ncbi:hypothetical protein Acy02nite_55390 [Actinoplanes cyaneus]|uniref:Uncharacterized protein n=2 Tax=Actinoplanes cyaneus TaxID=52696 RepID=A0A919M7T0_9ACTN|nr:hypothetical protein Acy02nite_55390 [Actinoplanes cyaneus]
MLALSACSPAKEATAPEVATLAGPSAAVSASPQSHRPRERLDTTPEEYEAMLAPYNKCIAEHGGMSRSAAAAGGAPKPASEKEVAKFDEANRICEPQYFPLPPWEKDPANPEAKDFARDVVKCLKGKGVKYVEVSDDGISIALGGDDNDARSISMGMDLIPGCERATAATRK